LIRGLVQGVGFRPFICRMAARHNLFGEVDNRTNGVSVIIQGDLRDVDRFSNDILQFAPPASHIKSIEINPVSVIGYKNFLITESKTIDNEITEISPDIAVCTDCLSDLKNDRGRIDYPLINCTNCGPRFTIMEGLPYDRVKTTMKDFRMCPKCSSEYNDMLDRRFHAQPIACNSCGPAYLYKDSEKSIIGINQILNEISSRLAAGKAVAIKGTGGYHLMCDALNNEAVSELRRKKQRDSKPFAVMFRDIADVRKYCFLDKEEENEITSWRRPVIILKQKNKLAEAVNSRLDSIGAMLSFMPIHHLLFMIIKTPAIVLTSGNISEEPVITDDKKAEEQLMPVAGAVVSYNREIRNRTDDSVIRVIDHRITIIRRSRGFVPRPIDLKVNVEGILALGAEQKNSFCIGKQNQAVMSQYIGDLKNLPAFDFFRESIERFSLLFRFKPELVACDLHPDYLSTCHAEFLEKELNLPLIRVQHHHAHIASCMAEYGIDEKVIGICMDGTGYGFDSNIWGGEFFVADTEFCNRFLHLEYIPLPGGDKAVDEPWRIAYSYLYKYFGNNLDYKTIPIFRSINDEILNLVRTMIEKNINSPLSSGTGRLFDAVSAILGLCNIASFDSEGPMRLESVINCNTDEFYPYKIADDVSFADMFSVILNDLTHSDPGFISAKFHNTIAQVILNVSELIRQETAIKKIILSGGVFQNKYLLEKSLSLLRKRKFEVFTNHLVPANDGGIALGQILIASKSRELCA
jgi:hydrogenase maturation protein HypF